MYSRPTGRLVPLWVLPKCTLDLLGAWFLCGSSRNVLSTYWAPGSSVGPPEMYSYLDLLGAWFLCGSSRNVLSTYWAPGSSVGPPGKFWHCTKVFLCRHLLSFPIFLVSFMCQKLFKNSRLLPSREEISHVLELSCTVFLARNFSFSDP